MTQPSPTHLKPKHHDDPAHKKGLRTVASIEFTKGVAGLLAGFTMLALVHKDLWDLAERALEFLHVNPDRRWAQALLDFADRVTERQLWGIAAGVFAYSTLRFVEAYGLWKTRVWAEWLAILSGLVYLPFEINELLRRATPIKWAVLLINLALVSYVAYVRISGHRLEHRAEIQEGAD
jgi:uncharacterized membrane protein (DUF2068 family)